MASVFVSTFPLTGDTGPDSAAYVPIPGLGALDLSTASLGGGGVALINLYLGWGFSSESTGFNFYISIVDTATGYTVIENGLGGTIGLNGIINVSAVYNIPANSQPVLKAYWKILGEHGFEIFPPSTFSFTAQVFPAVAVEQQ